MANQALPAQRSPGLFAGIEAAGGLVRKDARTGKPCLDRFWDGWGPTSDFTRAEARHGGRTARHKVLRLQHRHRVERQQRVRDLGEGGQSVATGSHPIHRSRALRTLLMTQATAEAQAVRIPDERVYTVTRAGPRASSATRKPGAATTPTSWHTMRWNQRMALNMSLSGMFNVGHDRRWPGPVPTPDADPLDAGCCLVPRMINEFVEGRWRCQLAVAAYRRHTCHPRVRNRTAIAA